MSHDSACNAAPQPAMMVNWYYRLVGMSHFGGGMPRKNDKSGIWRDQAADSGVREGRSSAG